MDEQLASASVNPEESALKFSSRLDRWLAAVAIGYALLALGVPSWHLGRVVGGGDTFDPLLVLLPLVILALLWVLSVPCEYELREKSLVARSGLIRFSIPLLAITRVSRTRTLVSAPAWSLDRLEIRYGKTHRLIISPERQAEFLNELKARAPQLVWVGEALEVSPEWISPRHPL